MADATFPPQISVVIPTYNLEQYIEKAIRSALSQKSVSVEVIMVDDCSTDNTIAVAQSIHDPRLKIIRQPQNGGPSVARNTGFSAAQGTWIAILDGDDAFADNRLSTCLNRGIETKADIVVDNLTVFDESTQKTYDMFDTDMFQQSRTMSLTDFIKGNQLFLGGHTLGYLKPVFRRDFLLQHGLKYATDIRIGEDYLFLAEALALGAKCVSEPDSRYIYTVRSGSISHRLNLESVTRIDRADQYFLSKYTLNSAEMAAQKKRTQNLHQAYDFTELVTAIKAKNITEIFRIILKNPSAVLPLWRPIAKRINGFMK